MPYPPQTKLFFLKKEKNTLAKTNAVISQTSSEHLKVTIQTYWTGNKELKMKLGQLHEEISKSSLPVSANLSNDFKLIILETDQRKLSPFMRLFWEDSKNVYNLLKIILSSPWTLILMLHTRQSIYLVLTNVLSASFLMFYITFDEISATLSIQFW